MRAGRLDRRVRVEVLSRARGVAGGLKESWTELYTLWMGKRDARATERFAAAQTVAEIDTVFTARFLPALMDVRPDTHRLVYRDRVYDVHGVAEVGRRDGVEIFAKARAEARYGD